MTVPTMFSSAINPLFHAQSKKQLAALSVDTITPSNDFSIKDAYTIVAHPDGETLATFQRIQETCRAIDPQQYYYAPEQLHLTILGGIDPAKELATVSRAVASVCSSPLVVLLYGLASNQHGASVSAHPYGCSLSDTREKLRKSLCDRGDDYTIHLPTYEQVGWINFLRYQLRPSRDLLDTIRSQSDDYLGVWTIRSLHIYRNSSRVLSSDKRQLCASVDLEHAVVRYKEG